MRTFPADKKITRSSTRGVWVYYYNDGARGFGHIGMIVEKKNGSKVRYSQGAINPRTMCVKIVIFRQVAKVEVQHYPPFTSVDFIVPNARLLKIPTAFPEKIEQAVEGYIARNKPYHSFTNNCACFIANSLNAADDVKIQKRFLPCSFYKEVKKFLSRQFQPARSL